MGDASLGNEPRRDGDRLRICALSGDPALAVALHGVASWPTPEYIVVVAPAATGSRQAEVTAASFTVRLPEVTVFPPAEPG